MRGNLLRNFQTAAVCQVRGNASRPERMAADFSFYTGILRPPPDLWSNKTLADISAEAALISQRIKSSFDPEPELLRQAELILFDYGMTCWEHVRPDPPKINISPIPAKGNPV
jgi:hypothetical protein